MKTDQDANGEPAEQLESSKRRDVLAAIAASAALSAVPGAAFAQRSTILGKITMEISENDRAGLRDAWKNYCDALSREGMDVINGVTGDAQSPQELAEALRAVARIGIMSLQHRMDFNDPDFPTFFRSMDDRYKYGGPDAHINYLTATLRGGATYRLRANHHHREFNINVSNPMPMNVDGVTKLALQNREMWPQDMKIADDGSFDVVFSSEQQPGNWMRLDPHFSGGTQLPDQFPMATGGLLLRTYYWDPEDGLPAGSFHIERVDEKAPLGPAPLTPARFVDQLKSAAELCSKAAKWWIGRPMKMRTQYTTNVISPPGQTPPGLEKNFSQAWRGPLNYGVTPWDLGPDEALYIESELPECRYWSFMLYNLWWESPDNQHRQTSISHKQAFLDTDGRFRAVIAHADPGMPNWLDTGGSRRGFLHYRWLGPKGEMPTPKGKVVKLSQVRSLLPPQHPHFDEAKRRAQLSARRAWFARRFQT